MLFDWTGARTRAINPPAYVAVQSFNKAAERIFGFHSKDIIGQDVSILMPHKIGSKHGNYMQQYIKNGGGCGAVGHSREVVAVRKVGWDRRCLSL